MGTIIVRGDAARELASRYPDLVVGRKERPMYEYKHPVAVLVIKMIAGAAAGCLAGKLVNLVLPNEKVDTLVDGLVHPMEK